MKYIVAILLTFTTAALFAQDVQAGKSFVRTANGELMMPHDSATVSRILLDQAISNFDKALIGRDSVALNELLYNGIAYGHSNGWVETKKELIADLYNGKLIYKTIKPVIEQKTIEGTSVAVRSYAEIDCVMDGKPMSFKLKVLQVWVNKNSKWQLFARQSVKI